MAHAHAHAHDHARSRPRRRETSGFTAHEAHQAGRLVAVLVIISVFFVLELGGAIVADSVVLQADAVHLLTDVLALGASLFAMRLAVRRPTPRFTYGLRRAEPVAAIFSALLVLATTAGIVAEGVGALHGQARPRVTVMLVVAVMALVANGLSAWLVHDAIHTDGAAGGSSRPHGHALNLRGVSLHLVGDTLGALAALCAAMIMRFGGPASADPIASFVVAAILLYGALRLLRDATLVLLEAAPPHLPVGTIRGLAEAFPGVAGVHDLHVWSLGAGHDAVTMHVRTGSQDPDFGKRLSERIRAELGVEYVTVQVEASGDPFDKLDAPL
jgi:cobalt-zinc-cadmium efflux system protein